MERIISAEKSMNNMYVIASNGSVPCRISVTVRCHVYRPSIGGSYQDLYFTLNPGDRMSAQQSAGSDVEIRELEILSISPNKWTDSDGTEWIFQ